MRTTRQIVISEHAVTRWQQRVAPDLSRREARSGLARFVSAGSAGPRPRAWMRPSASPGSWFIYWHEQPGVGAVVRDGVVVSVLVRHLSPRHRPARSARRGRTRADARQWRRHISTEEAL